NGLAVGLAEVAIKIAHVGIDRFRHGVAAIAEMQRRRRRDRYLGCDARMFLHEAEVVEHRMPRKRAELAGHAQHHRLRIDALKLDLALAEIGLDSVKRAEEIVIPEGAAEFAVCHGLEADILLPPDDLFDFAIFDLTQRIGGSFTALAPRARFLEHRRTQQAANVIGAERW